MQAEPVDPGSSGRVQPEPVYGALARAEALAAGDPDWTNVTRWPREEGRTLTPLRRLRACVEAWPECEEGTYDPRCCRFPKSCSCTVYDEQYVSEKDLEPSDD